MKTLFNAINVSTNESDAIGAYSSISHEEWQEMSSCDTIHSGLESIGVNSDDYNDYFDGVDVIENALNNSYPGETVYFWID